MKGNKVNYVVNDVEVIEVVDAELHTVLTVKQHVMEQFNISDHKQIEVKKISDGEYGVRVVKASPLTNIEFTTTINGDTVTTVMNDNQHT